MTTINSLNPLEAWQFMQENPESILIDVRSKVEFAFVGHPKGAVHIPWQDAPQWSVNPFFAEEVKNQIGDLSTPILLLCRSGSRSMNAAKALQTAGFNTLINIDQGFEGDLDTDNHRGNIGGWRHCELPWEQS